MKKIVQREQSFCDFCESEVGGYDDCLKCGKTFCHECKKTKGVTYKHAVWFEGSRDGLYCVGCNRENLLSGGDDLFRAYLTVERLIGEYQAWTKSFEPRRKEAEAAVERLWKRCES